METFEYGYLYLVKTCEVDPSGQIKFQSRGPSLAILRLSSGLTISEYDDSLTVMGRVGAEGWILGESSYVDSGSPPRCSDEIKRQMPGYDGWGYWSYFMRRRSR